MSALLLTAFALVVATNEICKSHDPMSITKASIEMPLSSNDDRRNEEKPDPLREEVDLAQKKLVKLKTTEIAGVSQYKNLREHSGIKGGWAAEEEADLVNFGEIDPKWMK